MGMMSAHHRIRRAMEEKKKAAREQAKQEAPVDVDKMLVNELKEYAKTKGIDITGLNKKEEIRLRILGFINASKSGGQPDGNTRDESTNQSEVNADQPSGDEASGNGAV